MEPGPAEPSLTDQEVGRQTHVATGEHAAEMTYTTADACTYIAKVRWQFAKTMPQWPHEYTVLQWRQDLEPEFRAFVALIRSAGIVKPWPRELEQPAIPPHLSGARAVGVLDDGRAYR